MVDWLGPVQDVADSSDRACAVSNAGCRSRELNPSQPKTLPPKPPSGLARKFSFNNMKPIILHLIPGLGHGGGEHQLLLNITNMPGESFEHIVCHLYPRTDLVPAFEKAGVTVVALQTTGLLRLPRLVWRLRKLIRGRDVSLIHVTNAEAGIVGGIAGRATGVPVVSTLNDSAYDSTWLDDNPGLSSIKLLYMKYSRLFEIKLLSSHHIAVSEHVKSQFVSSMGVSESKVDVIHRGVPDEFLDPENSGRSRGRDRYGIDHNAFVITNVGRLVPQKGQRFVIEAMPIILERIPNAILIVVGKGRSERKLFEIADRLGLKDRVRLVGTTDDILSVQQMTDVFVFPSLHEGCPGALLEAMGAGNPCIATDAGPMPELIENGISGILVQPQAPGDIADAVIRIGLDSQLAHSLGMNARDRVSAGFRISHAAAKTERLFERLTHVRPDVLDVGASTGAR